jgi:hypothetical protein
MEKSASKPVFFASIVAKNRKSALLFFYYMKKGVYRFIQANEPMGQTIVYFMEKSF